MTFWYDSEWGMSEDEWGSSVFLAGGGLRGGVTMYPKILGPPKCAHTVWETTTKFCTEIELHVRKILYCRQWVLTRDLFAVADLLVVPMSFCLYVFVSVPYTAEWSCDCDDSSGPGCADRWLATKVTLFSCLLILFHLIELNCSEACCLLASTINQKT